jgi:hypothetical protein
MRFLRAHTEIYSQMASGRPLISNPDIVIDYLYINIIVINVKLMIFFFFLFENKSIKMK